MQQRERILAGAVVVLLGGWLIDSAVVQPAMAWYANVEKQTTAAEREVGESAVLIERKAKIMADWRTRHAAGLLDDPDQARFHVQQTLNAAANSSGFRIDSISSGQLIPASDKEHYDTLRLGLSGRGSLAQVTAFAAHLENSAMPLAIERSEWSANDGTKDALDVALTVSTRLVNPAARPGRAVPDDTTAWKPEPRSDSFDKEVLAAKPFLSDRRLPRRASEPSVETPPPTVDTKPNDPGWGLVGIVVTTSDNPERIAFLRHISTNEERTIHVGDTIDDAVVGAIAADGLTLTHEGGQKTVVVGTTLSGGPLPSSFQYKPPISTAAAAPASSSSSRTTSRSSGFWSRSSSSTDRGTSSSATKPNETTDASSTKPPAAPFSVPAAGSDPAREAILERLRQQRNRSR